VCVCVCVCVCVSVSVCVLECIRQSVCVCLSWNGVEERGCELESEYEITRRRYSSSLHELHDKYMSYRNT